LSFHLSLLPIDSEKSACLTISWRHIVGATLARFRRLFLPGLALTVAMTSRSSFAQEQIGWDHHGKETYVSKGINVSRRWGTFVLYPGGKGKALYIQDVAAAPPIVKSVNLEYIAPFTSSTDPWVHYYVYKELGTTRLWAFQVDWPTLNGYVIYVKDGGEPWTPGWGIYDFAD
jgi:hypothetical protein